ncbi:MAG: hypothetical protein E4H14_19895 [Candidatus Thorarchaeota archaeon]|nr:MAG: hypothetical protein E4H14_19895 [Candidatus Thorarchaeota archaeon]
MNREIVETIQEQIGWLRNQIGPRNADRINELLDQITDPTDDQIYGLFLDRAERINKTWKGRPFKAGATDG